MLIKCHTLTPKLTNMELILNQKSYLTGELAYYTMKSMFDTNTIHSVNYILHSFPIKHKLQNQNIFQLLMDT